MQPTSDAPAHGTASIIPFQHFPGVRFPSQGPMTIDAGVHEVAVAQDHLDATVTPGQADSAHRGPLQDAPPRATVPPMSDTAQLVDAKVEASEARTREALARLEGEMRTSSATLTGRIEALAATLTGKLELSNEKTTALTKTVADNTAEARQAKWLILATVIASAIAVLAGVVCVLSYGGDSLGLGMEIGKTIEATVQEMQRRQPPPPAVPQPTPTLPQE